MTAKSILLATAIALLPVATAAQTNLVGKELDVHATGIERGHDVEWGIKSRGCLDPADTIYWAYLIMGSPREQTIGNKTVETRRSREQIRVDIAGHGNGHVFLKNNSSVSMLRKCIDFFAGDNVHPAEIIAGGAPKKVRVESTRRSGPVDLVCVRSVSSKDPDGICYWMIAADVDPTKAR